MLIMDYLDNIEEEYHKSYPDDPCPMEGGYKASFKRLVIESLGAEWDLTSQTEQVPKNGVVPNKQVIPPKHPGGPIPHNLA